MTECYPEEVVVELVAVAFFVIFRNTGIQTDIKRLYDMDRYCVTLRAYPSGFIHRTKQPGLGDHIILSGTSYFDLISELIVIQNDVYCWLAPGPVFLYATDTDGLRINDMVFVVALQPGGWGLEVIFMRTYNTSDSPWQFLSDLSVEYEKKSKEWKFNVIEAIAKCPKKDFLNEETQL
eukprot:gene13785-29309_t